MSTNLTAVVIAVTLLHVGAFGVMIWIRVRRCEADGSPAFGPDVTPCIVCGDPSTHRSYDGLDPNEQYDPHTGRRWSADLTHYPPMCAQH